ncbi:hypothetical protein LCGC14_0223980 [marine sediment metagenome]|uniref:Uncharacterized protein n=1 Tax=marine sediment metagenome TaxID=412755 RepID=A0A0F9UCC1_9ZZZZ
MGCMFCQDCYNKLIKKGTIRYTDSHIIHQSKCIKCGKEIPCSCIVCEVCYKELLEEKKD